jgi:DNA-binding CsgD family transcriptional regulator
VATVVNDAKLFPRHRAIDLSRLNEAERRVLGMLAEGHTAKSVANAIGSTPAAVNERLREARRKTGVGSSRELARMLKAQENRHEQMGVGRRPALASDHQSSGGLIRSEWKGPIAMTLALITALGAAALAFQQPNSTADASSKAELDDPLFASIFAERDPTKLFAVRPKNRQELDQALAGEGVHAVLRQLHAKVHSEPRDQAWASGTESALRAALTSIPNIGVPGTELRIACGSTLCEVAGSANVPLETQKREINEFNRATMSRLNPKALEPETDKLGLEISLGGIGTISENPPRLSYVFYYLRKS